MLERIFEIRHFGRGDSWIVAAPDLSQDVADAA